MCCLSEGMEKPSGMRLAPLFRTNRIQVGLYALGF